MSKAALRSTIWQRLKILPERSIKEQSANIAGAIRSLPEYRAAKKVAYYMHMEAGEIHTDIMIKNAFEDGKLVFLPRTKGKEMRMLQVRSPQEVLDLQPVGKYNLLEPRIDAPDAIQDFNGLDMIIVPGLAFTKEGHRLGRGAGYYDKYLLQHEKLSTELGTPKPLTVAVGLEEQLLSNVPVEYHDYIMDVIVINKNIFSTTRGPV